jgi:hypothetical protein
MKIFSPVGRHRPTTERTMMGAPRVNCAPEPRQCTLWLCVGALPRGPPLCGVGCARLGRLGFVVRPLQAERALCAWAAPAFGPIGHLKINNLFSIFI